jgi:hypothetical protein
MEGVTHSQALEAQKECRHLLLKRIKSTLLPLSLVINIIL